jgi:type II secretory pathway predicted ATPase ExeA
MRAEVMEFYGLTRSPRAVGYYETAYHRQLLQDIKQAVYDGDLVALCGVVGAGKTVTLRRLQEMLAHEGRVIVSKSVAVEKNRATLGTLITALFCDLSPDKEPRIPKQGELRERELRHLVRKRKKPIVLVVDEAHDLHHHTLTGLKRLIEMVADGGGKLSVLLAGHPKLRRDLRSPTMEEIGYRTVVFPLEGVTGSQREYIEWVIATCAAEGVKVEDVLDPAAVDLLASRLRTPLQHLTLAWETGYQASEKPVSEAIVDSVLSKQLDDLEPTLTRHGYTAKVLTEMLGTKPGEIKALIKDPRPKGRGIPRRDGEPFSYGGELDVGLADARA